MSIMARYLYSELAALVQARLNCIQSGNGDWLEKHTDRIETLVNEHMPSGSGFDSGTELNYEYSHADKLVFDTSFHHMDDNGYYCGWTSHQVIITPSFSGFHMRVSGRNYRDIKDYMGETFHHSLMTEVQK